MLSGIKAHRGTAILPQKTGPVIDVLYSAAGNSADQAWYVNGIVGYDFEIGDTHYNDTGAGPATCSPGQQPPFGANPNNNCLSGEGNAEGQEFASGNYGLLQSALDYQNDTAAPVVGTDVTSDGKGTYTVKFTSNEASSIYYTTDGSTPTTASTEWAPPRARALPLPLDLAPGTKLQWIAKDFKGNVSGVKSPGPRPDRHARHGRRQRAGHAGADAGRPGDLRRVHPGSRQDLHRHDYGDRGLHRR